MAYHWKQSRKKNREQVTILMLECLKQPESAWAKRLKMRLWDDEAPACHLSCHHRRSCWNRLRYLVRAWARALPIRWLRVGAALGARRLHPALAKLQLWAERR